MSKSTARIRARLFAAMMCLIVVAVALPGCIKPKSAPNVVEIKLTMWGKQTDMDFYTTALKEFHRQHPNIRVKVELIPWLRVFDKLLISTAGGRSPDVSRVSSAWFTPCASKGLLEPLSPFVNGDPEFDINDFYTRAVKGWGTFRGTLYAVPSDIDIYAMYYNKNMFDKYGVPYPNESWDWKRYLWAAKKLTKDTNGDGRVDQWGASPDIWWQDYVWQNGGDILNEDGTKCMLDQPDAYNGLQFMVDLRHKYFVTPSPGDVADIGANKLFTNGQIGMYISGSWAARMVFLKEIKDFDYDVAPLPMGKRRASFIGGGAFAVLRGSKHKKEAWELVKFMTSPYMQRHFAETQHIIPSRRKVAESGAYLYMHDQPTSKQVFVHAISYGRTTPSVPCSREMNDIILNEFQLAIMGKESAETACKKVTPVVDALLKYQPD